MVVSTYRVALTALLAMALISGCVDAGDDVVATSSPAPSGSLEAGLETPRYMADRRMLEIVLRNGTDETIHVETLRLDSPSFKRLDPTVRPVELPPHDRVDVPIPYGTAICGNERADASVELDLAGDGDAVVLPITSRGEVRRMYAEECRAEEVAEAAYVGYGEDWTLVDTRGGPAVEGTLIIRRRASDQRIAVDAVASNVVFLVTPVGGDREPLVVLEPGQDEASIGVRFRASRCEPHAVAESKKTFRFPMWVAMGDEEAEFLEVAIGGRGRQLLQDNVDDCSARLRAGANGAVTPSP